jgi:hypothetical protein
VKKSLRRTLTPSDFPASRPLRASLALFCSFSLVAPPVRARLLLPAPGRPPHALSVVGPYKRLSSLLIKRRDGQEKEERWTFALDQLKGGQSKER